MTSPLAKEDLRVLNLLLEKARVLENEFARPEGFAKGPRFETELAALKVLFQSLSFSEDLRVQRQADLADHLHPGMSLRHFTNHLLPIERLLDRSLRDDDILVTTEDLPASDATIGNRRPLTLVLDNLRSAFNVGSIYRMAETLRAENIFYCGYTPDPEAGGVRKTAMGTERLTPSMHFDRVDQALGVLRENGATILGLETSPQAKSLYSEALPARTAFVVGNERFGLDFHTLKLCDGIRQIPLVGTKNSLNVASALAIACFEWHRQNQEI